MSIKVTNDANNGTVTIKGAEVAGDYVVTTPNRNCTMAGEDVVIGVGQTWQDVTSNRAFGVTYTNSTGKPIVVNISLISVPTDSIMYVNGLEVANQFESSNITGNITTTTTIIIPPDATYSINTGTMRRWSELR